MNYIRIKIIEVLPIRKNHLFFPLIRVCFPHVCNLYDYILIYHLVIVLFSFQGSTKNFLFRNFFLQNLYDFVGGDEENRTPDPLLARQVLSQLSYTPV